MQHKNFNEDEWRAVEQLVSKAELAKQMTVMTGPVFTTADRYFTKQFGDFPVRIPSAFWKIITYVHDGDLSTQAYIFFQDIPSITSESAKARLELKNLEVTTTEVSLWTGLTFDLQQYDSNPLQFYSGPEFISTQVHKELLDGDGETVALNEGIVNQASIAAARDDLPIEDFYELIDEISWV